MSGKRFRFGTSMAVLCILALSACSPQFRNHGYVPNDEDLALITVGVDTRASVEEAVGAPAMSGVITDTATYYVQSRVRRFAWQEPEVVERQVLAISYDSAGVVTNIERFGLEDGQVVPISRRITGTSGTNESIIRRLIGSIGGFRASDFLE
ncbi:MAG: outer membrane protein assembly factor BamE [Paracoccaceae bacterium]|jgi:outer membrane protein assembly factor BamE (lipoprotein component of BamABCDE complex)|nr:MULTISPECIES: outer membrane protein assembly factor BamE [unclassified Seohaeicola]MDD9708547.1 outer membrane protein assembly factor BamE [Seohaeicola sp. 4SK31]MDD9736731.1 outer membrane protein assembly factor BamE [Seohaeicola sp. SP36]MDF1710228.1 outer membrane protein assembly factor BamE [Paracoccaceae bacterium]MDM7971376.1 outer membrane protein assembly factor BamE [Paracoccaceae bacterium]